ncbi:MAG: alpha/beta fold hydrolase [Actinobacteria bacterium]|jgi:carboxylesterase|nr:alpha/beta fold hydrolase [Actinomycetota bacterium]
MAIEGAPEGWIQDYRAEGSGKNKEIGVLLVHGFTGTPASMRPWAHYLNERGYTVSVPLIPGHGTTWHDLNHVSWQEWPAKVEAELLQLKKKCSKVFLCALSMGGGNSLYVAAHNQGMIDGIVLVNPMIHIPGVQIKFVHIISRIQKSRASVGDDIKKPGITEWGYDALPLKGVAQLYKYLKLARAGLPKIQTPTLVFHSIDDHILPVSNTEIIMAELGSSEKKRIELANSYHVATLDYDAETIFENSRLFIEERS